MTYIGNELHWKRLIEVDWLGQYVKAWVAFNAWYRNTIKPDPGEDPFGDREIIDKIKDDEGDICSTIEGFLSRDGLDEKSFQSDLADLHKSLDMVVVKSKEKKISFEGIEDYQYAKSIDKTERHGVTYEVKVDKNQKKRVVTVTAKSGNELFNETITKRKEKDFQGENWFENLVKSGFFERLSTTQRNYLKGYLEDSSPIHNLLIPNNAVTIIGTYKFTSDKKLIARSIVEILYELRNALFHGEITPGAKVENVYQPAYLVLKRIIPGV